MDNKLKELLKQHPQYVAMVPEWKFYESAFEGGTSFTRPENIFKHSRENIQDYEDRCKRAHYFNYCKPLVEFFRNFIFNDPISRTTIPEQLTKVSFLDDVSFRNESIDSFMKDVCDDFHIYGTSYVLVDSEPEPENLFSQLDVERLNLRPYWVLIKPYEIWDWKKDKFGKFSYVKRFVSDDGSNDNGTFFEYTKDTVVVTTVAKEGTKEVKIIDQKVLENKIKTIPIVKILFQTSRGYPDVGVSFLVDLAKNNRDILNLTSLLQEFLYKQAFNFLVIEKSQTIEDGGQEIEIGSSNVLAVPPGSTYPAYVSPPIPPAEAIAKERSVIKNEMFTRAAQDAMRELFNGTGASGFSQAQSFYKTAPFIANRAEILENAEIELFKLTMLFYGEKFLGSIKYKDRYEITSFTDALTQFSILVKDLHIPSETFVKHELKRLVKEYDGKIPTAILDTILAEIDSMKFTEWSEKIDKSDESPAAQQESKQTGTMMEVAEESMKEPSATNRLK